MMSAICSTDSALVRQPLRLSIIRIQPFSMPLLPEAAGGPAEDLSCIYDQEPFHSHCARLRSARKHENPAPAMKSDKCHFRYITFVMKTRSSDARYGGS